MDFFERNAKKTTAFVVVLVFCGMDFLSARIYGWYQEILAARRVDAVRVRSEIYHHGLAPKVSFDAAVWGERTYSMRTNSLGFVDRTTRDVPLRSDRHRLVFLGDSFTEGIGFSYEQSFVGLVDAELARDGVEVLNAAVVSYSPIVYWRKSGYLLEEVGLEIDEAVVFLDISDAEDEADYYFLQDDGNVGRNETPVLVRQQKLRTFLRENSVVVYNLLRFFYHLFRAEEAAAPEERRGGGLRRARWTLDPRLYEEYGEVGLSRMTLYMNRLRGLLAEHGVRLTVAVYPWPDQILEGDLDSVHRKHWRNWCREHDARFLDYFPLFVKESVREREAVLDRYFVPGDVHWNEAGHVLVAKSFLAHYRRRGTVR